MFDDVAHHANEPGSLAPDNFAALEPDRLASDLLILDAEGHRDRLRELILLAENIAFSQSLSKKLAPRFLDLAVQFRDSDDPRDEPVVWAAIRTGASMLSPSDAHCLLPLLEPGHAIETARVVLKMVGRIFEAQPPAAFDRFPKLAAKIHEIARSLLNPYSVEMNESAAAAQLAIYALVAIGDSGVETYVPVVRAFRSPWFIRRMIRKLEELRTCWQERLTNGLCEPARLLDRMLDELAGAALTR